MTDLNPTHVPEHGNSPLIHYTRAHLRDGRPADAGNHGFLYALSFPKSDYVQIGIGSCSRYDLNRQHQAFENIHYHDVVAVADQIARDEYDMPDGPLTQRYFGDEAAYLKHKVLLGGGIGASGNSGIRLRCDGALPLVMVEMQRKIFGAPLKGADILPLDSILGVNPDYDLVVRYDRFLDRVVIGVTPAGEGPRRWQALNDRWTSSVQMAGPAWEFVEGYRLSKAKAYHAAARWLQQGAVRLPSPMRHPCDFHFSGEALEKLCCAVVRQADRAWGKQTPKPSPLPKAAATALVSEQVYDAALADAKRLYNDHCNNGPIHCNRYPAWEELSTASKQPWVRKVLGMTD